MEIFNVDREQKAKSARLMVWFEKRTKNEVCAMKRMLIAFLSILLISAICAGPLAAEDNELSAPPAFLSITGIVTYVDESLIHIEDEDGQPVAFLLTEATCYPFAHEIGAGDAVTGYYRFSPIMPLIFPPQHTAEVLVTGMPEDQSIQVDRFSADENIGLLVSQDGMLALRIGENTQIITADGEAFDGELDGLDLAVIYDVSTRSIPAQTIPVTVIVLQ